MPTDPWQRWTAREWNEALFHHFLLNDGHSGPVIRLLVTDEELQKATGDERADPERVHEAFFATLRRSSWEINHRALSTMWLDRDGEWTSPTPPPFMVYLVLTCLVASATEGEVRGEGDFRERLRILLEHPAGTSYPLEDLPALWEALARWLRRSRESGAPVRELILPDPGRMTRIGYSVRLAFPERRDQLKLIRLLAPHRLGADPPIPTVLKLVEGHRSSFSDPFQDAFTNFRRAFIRSDARLDEYPFWSAVRDAATAEVPGQARGGPAFQLFLESTVEWQEELVLVADSEPKRKLAEVTFVPMEIGLGKYEYVVAIKGADDAADRAVRLLLHGVLERAVPDIRSSPVFVATDQGVLLFTRDETGVRELTSSCPDDDEVWALVREDLLPPFLSIFPLDRRPTAHPSPYSEWVAVSAFDGRLLRHFNHAYQGPLYGVRCLQPTVTGIHVRVSGGVPLQGAFLGLPLCLPVVKVRGADSVTLFSLAANSLVPGALERLCMVPSAESDEIFTFPDDGDLVLDGRFNLIAKAGAQLVAQRQITFRSAMIWSGYSRPTDPGRWMAEAMIPDVVVPIAGSEVPELASEPPTVGFRFRATARLGVAPSDQNQGRIPRRLVIPEGAQAPLVFEQQDEDERRLDRFIECCAGWAANRKGIAEFDFLQWIENGLSVEAYGLKFDIARAWTEGGFFDRFIQRRWRGRVYFARDPELVVWRSGSRVHGTLRGLAPRAVRNRVHASAEANGAQRRSTRSHSPWVPAPLSWSGESSDIFERVATEAEVGPIRWIRPVSDFVAPIAAVTAQIREFPMHYLVKNTWDWDQGRFTTGTPQGRSPVEVRWLRRSDRPAYYEILINNELFWLSHSRDWALLVAYTIAGVPPYQRVGTCGLMRAVKAQTYLPVPLGRSLATTAECSPGPAKEPDGNWTYWYTFSSTAERERTLALLWGSRREDCDHLAGRVRWLLAVARSRERGVGTHFVPIPSTIRRTLNELEIPEARELAGTAVPVFLIPHLRRLVAVDKT